MITHPDPWTALRLTAMLAGAGVFLTSLRHVSHWRWYGRAGIYPWRLPHERTSSLTERIGSAVFEQPGITLVLVARGISGLWICIAAVAGLPLIAPATVLLTSTLIKKSRLRLMNEEAETMYTVLLFPLAFHAWKPDDAFIAAAGLWFIAAQLCLAYVGAGLAKLSSSAWRRGDALARVLDGSLLRRPALAESLRRRPVLGRLLGHSAIGFQLCFPLGILMPPLLPLFLTAGFLFHFGIGVTFGLWSFFWAFLAAYPAAAYVAARVSSALWG